MTRRTRLFAWAYLAVSVAGLLGTLSDLDGLTKLYFAFPEWAIAAITVYNVGMGVFGAAAAVGILGRRDGARRAAAGLAAFDVALSVPLFLYNLPGYVVYHYELSEAYAHFAATPEAVADAGQVLLFVSAFVFWAGVAFRVALARHLTRPSVRDAFRR